MRTLRSGWDLAVWKKSIDWVEQIYLDSRAFRLRKKPGLTGRLRRAAVEGASNRPGSLKQSLQFKRYARKTSRFH
jgi:hypothetical protein